MGTRVLLVDLSNLAWRAVCSHASLSHKGEQTGGVYGFLQIICKIVNTHRITRIVVCDDAKPYHREKVFPSYKAGRGPIVVNTDHVDMRGPVSRGKHQIAELLDFFGLSILSIKGFEADDLIARATLSIHGRSFIASNDSDLYQCLCNARKVVMCKKAGVYAYKDFVAEYGVMPTLWPHVLALCGSHNGVPGIAGVGLKTAAKLVAENASDRYICHKYHLEPAVLQMRRRLATYPWDGALKGFRFTVAPFRYERRRTIAWLHMRFAIDFAPYMQNAFQLLATP